MTPEGEIGPYFADDGAAGFKRSNIRSNVDGTRTQPGIPLSLTVRVRDSRKGCAPVAGARIDVWHCNASGVYSDESDQDTSGETWLRGYQLTNADGIASFATVVPGWYQGRTTHVHVRVRSAYDDASSPSDGSNTTQIFFPQATIDAINTTIAPYRAHGANPTTNAGDRVYAEQTRGATLVSLAGSPTTGFSATFIVDLPITSG